MSGNPSKAGFMSQVGGDGVIESKLYITIDTSGSMYQAGKMDQVISSVLEMLDGADGDTDLVVRTFSKEINKIVEGKRRDLNLHDLVTKLQGSKGSVTALYDAWATTINETPQLSGSGVAAHIVIFTDGEDNASKKFTCAQVEDLLNQRMNGTTLQCSFLQGFKQAITNITSQRSTQIAAVTQQRIATPYPHAQIQNPSSGGSIQMHSNFGPTAPPPYTTVAPSLSHQTSVNKSGLTVKKFVSTGPKTSLKSEDLNKNP